MATQKIVKPKGVEPDEFETVRCGLPWEMEWCCLIHKSNKKDGRDRSL